MQKLSLGPGQDPAGSKESRDYIGFRVVLAGYRLSGSMGLGKASQAMLQLCTVMQKHDSGCVLRGADPNSANCSFVVCKSDDL